MTLNDLKGKKRLDTLKQKRNDALEQIEQLNDQIDIYDHEISEMEAAGVK